MTRRTGLVLCLNVLSAVTIVSAQTVAPPAPLPAGGEAQWIGGEASAGAVTPVRYGEPDGATSYNGSPAPSSQPQAGARPVTPIGQSQQPPAAGGELAPVGAPSVNRARVSKGSGRLPNDAGQVWREYDIQPYSQRLSNEPKPQQRVVDWILRETGYEAWHGETVGILNADRETLTVYHTPAMQAIVADIVDRFVNGRAADLAFSMRIVTVRNPDWRVRALSLMTPISVQSPGLQGWIMPKENYALLSSELARRGDVRDYNAAGQLVPNGQAIVFSTMRPRGYIKGIVPTQNAWPGYQPETGTIEEGASLEFNPLLSLGLDTAEAVVKFRLNQVEKMRRVSLDLPTPGAAAGANAGQRLQIEVPQITSANLHERFRWPADQVLVLSMGMVATPGPESGNAFSEMIPDMIKGPPRADALLFVEARNSAIPTAAPNAGGGDARFSTAVRPTPTFHGRY
ncbi:hypothetical protein Pla108_00860 [Botrimarina colliarenosi]|uniref:Bacterial type II and III secretion system protein n=1 Tax=Botrimarina colliarenosi TaxID=2528001 RepID=A0A5C6AGI5_9BACT|nr:hypothetical protein [Botrimarina colliarenosi]TWT99152.1 hypothetical protein Pla108_00860 [Botrimarina colliarenosi]